MKEYCKIESLYNRDKKTFKFKIGEFRLPEFEYLSHNDWLFTEKVDGTNIRIMWDGETVQFRGRTDRAQIPTFLHDRLVELFSPVKFSVFDDPVCLYGEGFGAKIQKGGDNYKADGVDFVLFDVLIGKWWLCWDDICDIGNKLEIQTIPTHGQGPLLKAAILVEKGIKSAWGDFPAEGLVCRPMIDLLCRNGKRIMVKMKTKDFEHNQGRRND